MESMCPFHRLYLYSLSVMVGLGCLNNTRYLLTRGYFILLMITDGVITDMAATKEAIVKVSGVDLSMNPYQKHSDVCLLKN